MTVFVDGLLCLLILRQLIKNDPSRHFWIVVISVIEIVGGWMTFAPEVKSSIRGAGADSLFSDY
jgi:general stress protein CsbA